MTITQMEARHVVEAALFSAGKPVSVEEIVAQTFLPPEAVKEALKKLEKHYDELDTVLEIRKAGSKWAMQVRAMAAEPATKFAPPEIPKKLLKTLALIAYHQPMKQSELADMIGSKVYDHVPELVERGLVKAREEGVTKILMTTPAFPEYFGLDAEDREEVRATLTKLVGLPPPPPKTSANKTATNDGDAVAEAPSNGEAADVPPAGAAQTAEPPTAS
jgi:segregation and condensation protein B